MADNFNFNQNNFNKVDISPVKIVKLNVNNKPGKSRTQRTSPVKIRSNGKNNDREIHDYSKKEIELCYDQELQKFQEDPEKLYDLDSENSYPEVEFEKEDKR